MYLKHLSHQVSNSHHHLKVKEGILDYEFINYLEMVINYNVGFFETSMEPDPNLFSNCTFQNQMQIINFLIKIMHLLNMIEDYSEKQVKIKKDNVMLHLLTPNVIRSQKLSEYY